MSCYNVGQGVSLEEAERLHRKRALERGDYHNPGRGLPQPLFNGFKRAVGMQFKVAAVQSSAQRRERPSRSSSCSASTGVEPDIDDDLLLGPSGRGDNRLERGGGALLRVVPSLLGYTNHLVVVGVDSDDDLGLLEDLGRLLLKEAVPGSVSFWGMGRIVLQQGEL
jgi:hypothetical protein